MRIYELNSLVDVHPHLITAEGESREYQETPPPRHGAAWRPPRLKLLEKHLPPSDTPGLLPGFPIFNRRAVDVLRKLVEPSAEILPVDCQDGEFYLINVYRVLEAFDIERSEIEWFPNAEEKELMMSVERYEFIPEKIGDYAIFRTNALKSSWVYVTDRFVRAVEEAELVGFVFTQLWEG